MSESHGHGHGHGYGHGHGQGQGHGQGHGHGHGHGHEFAVILIWKVTSPYFIHFAMHVSVHVYVYNDACMNVWLFVCI